MTSQTIISVDAMSGDHGAAVAVPAVAAAAAAAPHLRFLLHGDAAVLEAELSRHPAARAACTVRPAERVIGMEEKPAQALRRGKGSSLWNAVEAVKAGEAAAAVSAGNTGALMAISRLLLRMIGGMERPALVAAWPTMRGASAVLDVGANVDCDARRLVEFAVMGAAYHRAALGSQRPTVGLLNVGSEDEKGHEEVREAHRRLKEARFGFDYHGFVEGTDISLGTVDVVVTDGFTGNVALKTAEGVAKFVGAELRAALTSTLLTKAGAVLASSGLKTMRSKLNPASGAPLLGLRGVVIKAHGGSDAPAFAAAVKLAADLAGKDFVDGLRRDLERLAPAVEEPSRDAVAGGAVERDERDQDSA